MTLSTSVKQMTMRWPRARQCQSCARFVFFPAAHFDTRCQAAWKARTLPTPNRVTVTPGRAPLRRGGLARTHEEAAR